MRVVTWTAQDESAWSRVLWDVTHELEAKADSGTGTGCPHGIRDGQPLLRLLHAHTSHVHVAYHREPEASVLRVSADTWEVQNRWDKCDGAGTMPSWSAQEAQGHVEGDHRGVGRRRNVGPLPTPKVVGKATPLEKALAAIMKEMKVSQKSLEKIAQDTLEVLWEMLSQMVALVDLVELVVEGKRYVRTWEMGQPESGEEELPMRWSKKGKGKAKETGAGRGSGRRG